MTAPKEGLKVKLGGGVHRAVGFGADEARLALAY
jgi:hypothetical protein